MTHYTDHDTLLFKGQLANTIRALAIALACGGQWDRGAQTFAQALAVNYQIDFGGLGLPEASDDPGWRVVDADPLALPSGDVVGDTAIQGSAVLIVTQVDGETVEL